MSTDPDQAALYVEGLTKTFGEGAESVTAVDDVSFAIEPGSIVGLLGPNGAGKTTTIKTILRLVLPDRGTVYINGIDVSERPQEAFESVDAMLEGARNDYWRLTVRENLRYFGVVSGEHPGAVADRYERLIDQLDLTEKADVQVRDLSRGMKQKVSLASVLASDVSVAFLDEPTLGLDVKTSLTLRQELTRIVNDRNITVILSSHDMDVIEDICDRIIIMNDGRIIADSEVDQLLNKFDKSGYRISVSDSKRSEVKALRERYNINEIKEFSGRLTFDVTADNETFYDLIRFIENRSLTLESVESTKPNLEEIFLEITGERDDT